MNPLIQALRAITSRYALTVLNPILKIAAGIIIAILICLTILVIKVSLWWLILLVPFIGTAVLLFLIGLGAHVVAHVIAPDMNKIQKQATKEFVNKAQGVAEGLQTPQFMIIYYLVRDVLRRKWDTGFVKTMTTKSTQLKPDFDALVKLF